MRRGVVTSIISVCELTCTYMHGQNRIYGGHLSTFAMLTASCCLVCSCLVSFLVHTTQSTERAFEGLKLEQVITPCSSLLISAQVHKDLHYVKVIFNTSLCFCFFIFVLDHLNLF